MAVRLMMLLVALLALGAGSTAGGEQLRVDGMGRTPGWVVAGDDGNLVFVDCQGRRSMLGSARIESSASRCPVSPAPLDVTGIIRSVDPVRRIVNAQDDAGQLRTFHITEDVARLDEFRPGERIRATGPIDGQVTRITRP
jgi:hypothetical protein